MHIRHSAFSLSSSLRNLLILLHSVYLPRWTGPKTPFWPLSFSCGPYLSLWNTYNFFFKKPWECRPLKCNYFFLACRSELGSPFFVSDFYREKSYTSLLCNFQYHKIFILGYLNSLTELSLIKFGGITCTFILFPLI